MSMTDATTNYEEEIPASDQGKVTHLLRTHPEAYRLAVERPHGYATQLQEIVTEELGEEMTPEKKHAYYNAVHSFDPEETEAPDGYEELVEDEGDEEEVSVANLSATALDITEEPCTTEERIQSVIMEDDDLLREAYTALDDEFIQDVIEEVKDVHGPLYAPTEGAVRSAVHSLREHDELPEFRYGEGLDEFDGPAQIFYVCELCGHRRRSYQAIKDHISCTDDATHADRSGKESHLISTEGEDIEDTHEAFASDEFREAVNDGFDVLWTIYQNPNARQGDVADVLDMSPTTLHKRLNELGIEWEDRERQVEEIIDEMWTNGEETVTINRGNNSYTGSATGLNTTSGRPGQNITDRPVKERTFTVELSAREAKDLLTGRDPSAVKQRILNALLDD